MDTTDQFVLVDEDDDYVLVDAPGAAHDGAARSGSAGAASDHDNGSGGGGDGVETDPARLAQREKQVAYGKNTDAYRAYIKAVPK